MYRPCKTIVSKPSKLHQIISVQRPKDNLKCNLLIGKDLDAWCHLNGDTSDFPTMYLGFFDPPLHIGSKDEFRNCFEEGKYWFPAATIIHEFCHLLGLNHEHQHPDFKYELNVSKIIEYYGSYQDAYTQVLNKYYSDECSIIDFDPHSIMLYYIQDDWFQNFEKEGFKNPTKYNYILSRGDKEILLKAFPKDKIINIYVNVYYESPQMKKKKWIYNWIETVVNETFNFIGVKFHFKKCGIKKIK